jgi:antitoxin VbhA-like protein
MAADANNGGGRLNGVTTLSPDARRLLDDVAASALLEGHKLPLEDLELAQAYLAGEIDAATFQERVRRLVDGTQRPAQSA